MNFMEAVKAMKEGKKVTRPCWGGYIYMNNKRRVYHRDGEMRNIAINDFEATDWKIVEETKTLSDKVIYPPISECDDRIFLDEDEVEQFIKDIKEDIKQIEGGRNHINKYLAFEVINKRAGERLIK